MPSFVFLQSALPGQKVLCLRTDQIAHVVPIRDPGIGLVTMQGGFEAAGYVVTLESACIAGLVQV
jgi:hypothetical protein